MLTNRPYKVGMFVDGGFYKQVIAHYLQNQHRGAMLDPGGLLEWCRGEIARRADIGPGLCRIVEARYVRAAALARMEGLDGKLETLLRRGGILVQEAPRDAGQRGLEVCLAVEALDATLRLGLDAVVLVAGSTAYLPLARKVTAAGAALMVLGFDVSAPDRKTGTRRLRTANALLDEAVWPTPMSGVLEGGGVADSLFAGAPVTQERLQPRTSAAAGPGDKDEAPAGTLTGSVADVRERMGFLLEDWNKRRLFFHFSALVGASLHDLRPGDRVEYERGLDPRDRPCALQVRPLIGEEAEDSTLSVSDGPEPEDSTLSVSDGPSPEPEPAPQPDDSTLSVSDGPSPEPEPAPEPEPEPEPEEPTKD